MYAGRVGRAAAFAAALVFAVFAADIRQTGVSLSPVRVDLGQGQRSAAVTVTNGSSERVVQAEAFRWSRVDGEDRYTASDDLIVNPPLFRLKPGAKQVVRIGPAMPAEARLSEQVYRVYFQEVPEASAAVNGGPQLQIVLRLGVPVFIAPNAVVEDLHWRAASTADGLRLELSNSGNVHVRLTDLAVVGADAGRPIGSAPALRYIFPGETYAWTFPVDSPLTASSIQVAAESDRGPVHAEIAIDPR